MIYNSRKQLINITHILSWLTNYSDCLTLAPGKFELARPTTS